jgi:hypothetical protein
VRLLKMLYLAVFTAVAVMVSIVGPASAETFCEQNTNPCPEASRVAVGKLYALLATGHSAILLDNAGQALLKCDAEKLGKVTATGGGKPVIGEITKTALINCLGACSKATGVNLSYKEEAIAASAHVLISKGTGAGKPGFTIEGCPFGVTCKFEITNASALLSVSGSTQTAKSVPFTLLNPGLCSIFASDVFLDASYAFSLDLAGNHATPIFLVASP